jgi:AraC-like DNA-binding protein
MRRKLVIGIAGLALAAFAGGAYAATQESSDSARQAFLNDVAKRLNVSPQSLSEAFKAAFVDRLQQAVRDGRLTQAQANAIKQRIEQGGPVPFLWPGFGPHRFGFGPGLHPGLLRASSSYLGFSEIQLLDQLSSGKSLAQIATSRGKSVNGLKVAITSAEKSRLDEAVAAKAITSAQEQRLLSRLSARLDELVNRKGFAGPRPMLRMRSWGAMPPGDMPAVPPPPGY